MSYSFLGTGLSLLRFIPGYFNLFDVASLIAQMVENLPAMQDTQVRSLGQEDSLEKEMATHSSIPAWKFHGQRSPWSGKGDGHNCATK